MSPNSFSPQFPSPLPQPLFAFLPHAPALWSTGLKNSCPFLSSEPPDHSRTLFKPSVSLTSTWGVQAARLNRQSGVGGTSPRKQPSAGFQPAISHYTESSVRGGQPWWGLEQLSGGEYTDFLHSIRVCVFAIFCCG